MPVRVAAVLATLAASLGLAPIGAAPVFTDVCVVNDSRAMELSGLVATATGYVSVNDSNFDPARIRIFYLDRRLQGHPYGRLPHRRPATRRTSPSARTARMWVADIGDNITSETHRTSIALWRVPPDGSRAGDQPAHLPGRAARRGGAAVRRRRPAGRRDQGDRPACPASTPPTGPLKPNTAAGVPLTKVGEFTPKPTGVVNPFGLIGERLVTGAASSPDRHRVALRTYTAAYEWDVPDGDVVKAITTTTPRFTPLPGRGRRASRSPTPPTARRS